MRDSEKSKEQLIRELERLRTRVAQLEKSQAGDRKAGEDQWGSEGKLRAIFKSITDGIVVTDLEGRVVEVSDALIEHSGYSKEEIVGSGAWNFFSDEDRDLAGKHMGEMLSKGLASAKFEYTLVSAVGEKYPVEVRTSILSDSLGNPTGFVGVIRDVTEQKQIDYELKRKHDELQLILDSVPALIYFKDNDGKILNMNKATASLAIVPKEKLLKKTVFQLMPETADKYHRDDMEVITSGKAKMNIEEQVELLDRKIWLKTDKLPMKDEDGNIIGLIGFSVDITERKMAEDALRKSEEKLRVMFESMTDGVVVTDLNTTVVDVNKAALDLFGYRKDEVIGRNGFEILSLDQQDRAMQEMARSLEGTETSGIQEYSLLTRDGSRLDAEISINKLSDVDGNPYGFVTVIRDVTERKKAEESLKESEERYRLIAENMSDVIWIMNLDLEYQYVSPSIEHMRGFTVEEAMAMKSWEYLSEESLKTATKRITEELELEKKGGMDPDRITTIDMEVMRKNGSWMWIEAKVSFLRDGEGKPVGLLGVSRDITERKKVQEALRESEEKLRVIFDSMGDAATVVDLQDNITDCNEAAVRLHGFGSKSELIGRKASELVAPVDRERAVKDAVGALKEPYESGRAEYKLLTKDGREFDGEFGVSMLKDRQGKPTGFIGLAHDISERKAAAEALRKSEEKYRLLFENSIDGKAIVDAETNEILLANKTALKLFGFSSKTELEGLNIFDYIHPADKERIAASARNNAMFKVDSVSLGELRTLTKTGEEKWILVTGTLSDYEGRPAGLTSFIDITERRKAEDALKKSEEKYRDLVEKEKDVIFSVDALGFITSINPAVRNWGYTVEEVQGKNFIELIPEDWREKTAVELQNALLASGELMAETRVVHKSGEVLPIEYSAMIIKEGDQYAGVQGIVRDISERKKAEEALRQSEEKFRVLFESIPDGISVIDMKTGKLVDSNPAALRMFGFSRDEVIGQEAFNLIAEKDRAKAFDDIQNTLIKGQSTLSEWCLLGKGGKEYDCESTASVINDNAGAPAFMVNVVRDITERKRIEKELDDYRNNLEKMVQERTSDLIKANQELKREVVERKRAEEALRESEQKYRTLFEDSQDAIIITTIEGEILDFNHSLAKLVGYSREELLELNAKQLYVNPDDRETLKEEIKRTGAVRDYAVKWVRKDGGLLDVLMTLTACYDVGGDIIGYQGIVHDITERRKAEQALRESEARSRAILEAMPDLIFQMSRDGVFIDYKGPMEGLYMSPEQFVGKRVAEVMPSDIADLTVRSIKNALDTGRIQQYSYELNMEGEIRHFDARMAAINDDVALVIVRDVTERRNMENALKISEEKLRGIFNSIKDAVVLTDLDFTILEVNDASLEMSGCKTKEELIGTKGYDLIAPDDITRAMATQPEAVEGHPVPRAEYKIINKLGKEIYADVGVSMYQDPSGSTVGFVAVLKDITEHRRMEDALRDSEEKLRVMFSSMADGVVVTDLEGKITDLNEAQLRMFGFADKKEVIGKGGFDFIVERDRDRAFKEMMKVFEDGYNIGSTFTVADNSGKEFECELSTAMLHEAAGKASGFITVMRDVTERRRMEQALRDSEEKLRIIFESIGDGIIVTDLEGIITETNEAAAKLGGWSDKGQLVGMSGFDFVAEQERPKMVADMIKALREQRSINVEYSVKDKDDREYQSEVNVTLLRDAASRPKGIVSVIRDITERKRMEQDLRDSEEMSRGMIESAATAVCIVKDGKFAYVSPMFAEMTGYSIDELIGTRSTDYIHQDDRDSVTREAVANLKGDNIAPHEYRLLRKDGSFIWILEKVASIRYKGERAAIGSLLDITRLKQVEEALRDSEEKLRIIFASLPDGVTVTDMNGTIVEENEAGIKMSGFASKDQVIGLNGFDFIASSDRDRALADLPKIFETGVSGPLEYKMVDVDGNEYDGEIIAAMMRDKSGNPQGFITVIRDITERKKAREELQESQEMTRGMLESAATGIYLVQDGKFKYVNPLFTGISGYTLEELLESDSMNYIHPDDRETARAQVIENLKGISDRPHEFRFLRKDGQSTWILEKVASIEYKGRRAAIGSFMDISERKHIEEMLQQRSRELEQRTNQLLALQKITTSIQSTLDLKEIMQQVADGVVHNLGFDHALIIKVDEAANVSRGMVFATKYDASKVGDLQDIIGRRLTDIEIPQIRGYSQTVDNAMDGKATITRDFFEVSSTILSREESDVVAEMLGVKTVAVMPLFARDRHVGSILALTDREEIDNVLMEPLRILSDQAGVAVENADLYHGVSEYARRLSVITSLSKILGSSLDIKGVYRAFTEEVRKVMDFDRTSIAMVEDDRLRYFVVAEDIDTQLKDGADLPLSDSATGLVVKTKRTLIEPDFEQEMKFPIDHMYYRSGLRSAIRVPLFSKGEVFATFNLASRNPNAYGEREKEILEQISGSLTAAIENSRLFNQVKQHEAELLKAYEDLKSAQAYMLQAEKLRALGEMAGGVAHDFNNILAVVLGRTQLALEDVKDEKLKKDLQIIEQTAMDAATTVRRLQDFARVRVERNFEVLDLKEVVESALQMAESRRVKLKEREGVTIDIESKLQELSPVEGDAAELREGLLNIIFNAMDAMPDGGKITLKATQTKKWVTLAISDTGIGMPEDVRKKIFEPFFTTRIHKGTGLGLSVTYGIIQRHRGDIWVESNEGAGSTFKIKLPVCEGVVCKKSAAGKTDIVKSISILMVDDNPEVAGILSLTLKRLGHKVVEANSGEAAINTFEVGNFDLVITDLGMPDMSGHEVAKIVKEIKPGTPVLVISGWGGQLNLDDMPEVDGVIAKPFSKDVLSEKIAALLSGEGARAGKVEKKAPKKRKTSKASPKIDKTDGDKTGGKKPIKKGGSEKRRKE